MGNFHIIAVVLCLCFPLISCFTNTLGNTCPNVAPTTVYCGPNAICTQGCCSSSGFCGTGSSFCGCGCQNGACLIPSITLPSPSYDLVAGATTLINVKYTSPVPAYVWVDILQETTFFCLATIKMLVSTGSSTVTVTEGWLNTTTTGTSNFYYNVMLVNQTTYNADPANAWKYPTAFATYHGITVTAPPPPTTSSPTTVTPTQPTTLPPTPDPTQTPTTLPPTSAPTNPATIAPSPTDASSSNPSTTSPTTSTPTMTHATASSPTTSTSTSSSPTSSPSLTPSEVPQTYPGVFHPTRTCPAVGNDDTMICQGCGYTRCRNGIALYYDCPTGMICNPYTNFCDAQVTCSPDRITPIVNTNQTIASHINDANICYVHMSMIIVTLLCCLLL